LKEDQTEVEIMETTDFGDADLHTIIEGDKGFGPEDESLGDMGFTKQEFDSENELVDVEENDDEMEDDFLAFEEVLDDDM